MASLAPTGDWSRFGKNTGLSMVSSVGGWGGAELGAMAGTAVGGPIGGLLGRLVGGLGGGFAGRWSAGRWSGLREITDAEVEKSYETIVENCAKIGVYPDPSLSKRDIVAGMLDESTSSKAVLVRITGATAADLRNLKNSLSDWQQGSPEGFEVFLQGLRDAATSELPIFAQRSLEGNVQHGGDFPEFSTSGDVKTWITEIKPPTTTGGQSQASSSSSKESDTQQKQAVRCGNIVTRCIPSDDALCILIGPLKLYIEYSVCHAGSQDRHKDLKLDIEWIIETHSYPILQNAEVPVIDIEELTYASSLSLDSLNELDLQYRGHIFKIRLHPRVNEKSFNLIRE
ncbi:uncharacterized protein FFFS_15926 [Fusarium fujikuroi]|nr:uncharacterized protein FFFS_15926 [Fusarium fujikuroi]